MLCESRVTSDVPVRRLECVFLHFDLPILKSGFSFLKLGEHKLLDDFRDNLSVSKWLLGYDTLALQINLKDSIHCMWKLL